MWNRRVIKEKGKACLRRNYWKSVLTALIYMIFFASSSAAYKRGADDEGGLNAVTSDIMNSPDAVTILAIIGGILGVAMVVSFIINIFVLNPLEAGCNRFFLVNQSENAKIGEWLHCFKNNYITAAVALFVRDIFIAIGFILLFIPGIIMCYSYRLVPYIVSEDPAVSIGDALKRSRMMMKGQKWKCFVFDLSFIGWGFLSLITLGLVGLFYGNPYYHNADAALYQAIRETNGNSAAV